MKTVLTPSSRRMRTESESSLTAEMMMPSTPWEIIVEMFFISRLSS